MEPELITDEQAELILEAVQSAGVLIGPQRTKDAVSFEEWEAIRREAIKGIVSVADQIRMNRGD